MENSSNPQNPANADDSPETPTPSPDPQQSSWTAPTGAGAWGAANTSQTPTSVYEPPTSGGNSGNVPPPTDFVFVDTPSSSPSNNGNKLGKRIAGGVVVLLLMVGSGATGALLVKNDNDNASVSRTVNTIANTVADPASQPLAKIAANVQPVVVSIEVSDRRGVLDTGSGFILHSDGTIVTNNHVIAAAAESTGTSLNVKFSNGDSSAATIVGRDASTDIAVIKATNANGLTAASLGTSSSLHVGDAVLALGSPLGLDGSVASGIVSALHRTVNLGNESQQNPFGGRQQQAARSIVADAIQTDAAINPGNSGGPLVDINGNVVGVNTAIASLGSTASQSGSIGVGFAIPIDEVQSVAEQLIRGETPKHALLGVQISDDNAGALVQDITAGGAAEKAGLQEGDVISKFGDKKITSADELSAAVRTKKPDDKVTITYTRKSETKTAEVTLGSASE